MSEIRGMVLGTFNDYGKFTDLAKRLCGFIEEHEPGTLLYEFFADEASSRFVVLERYADAGAFMAHNQNLVDQGFMGEVGQLATFDSALVLGGVQDEQAKAVFDQLGAVELSAVASVDR